MEVLLESEEQMGRNKQKGRGKRQRPNGPPAPSPAVVAEQTGRLLAEREREWLGRLTTAPASFTDVEFEVHEQARRQADLYVAGLLAKASKHTKLINCPISWEWHDSSIQGVLRQKLPSMARAKKVKWDS